MNLQHRKYKGITFGSVSELNDESCEALVKNFEARGVPSQQLLNGRGNVVYSSHPTLGRIVIKRYLRGGAFRHLVKNKYLRWGTTRSEHEFNLLNDVRSIGINAPEPLVFAYKGRFFYDAWLVTREIEGRVNFADLSVQNEDYARSFIDELVRQLSILITHKIFHIDLHPGNVVIDANKKLYILDFDKAEKFSGAKNKLRDLYLVRWRRAVIKHSLPETLSEYICPGLRLNFAD